MIKNLAHGTGRRKTATARVYLRQGKGEIVVNGKAIADFFPIEQQVTMIREPLVVTDAIEKYDILITVRGGGITGQAGACRHGISRALLELDETNRLTLKANGFLTRDSRMVERKKYGQKGARSKFQFSKR
ncbi:30S ribosomal protein S9 [Oceanispirochaeta sp.]|uniref:30S ribosomal protein S9 n=1 Tax=Oceanispirochaeta sp. TaxID=2035350 RepID=UPI00260882FE|nr:30S ribosomal protein S9 [Oceanispirochaeta sp.]MDA3957625.1 30S ribosomal protein S9 [Oceanispirochaeta sp.]